MEAKIFAVRDTKSDGFARPSFFISDEAAIRAFSTAVDGGDENMTRFPDDFTLYRLGVYDDESGIITGSDPDRVLTGLEALSISRRRQEKLDSLKSEIARLNGEGGDGDAR